MPKKTISIRVPPDTHERFEEYREENTPDAEEETLSKADAGRRLLEAGLDVEAERQKIADGGFSDEQREEMRAVVGDRVDAVHRTLQLQNVATAVGIVYIAAVAGGLLVGGSAVVFGVLVLAAFATSFLLGGRDE